MPQLTMTVKDRQDMFGRGLVTRLNAVLLAEQEARRAGARAATIATRKNFQHKREIIAPRRKRSSTGGKIQQHLTWKARNNRVEFDIAHADAEAPHWIIQELGTGKRGTIKQGGTANPTGRPKTGATYVRTVKSQKGRRISGGLVFASNGQYSPPGARRDQQLHWASRVTGVPRWNGKRGAQAGGQAAAIRIRNEIQGQHFVKKGGQEGFREYRSSVLAAARQHFRKPKP